MPEAGVRLLGRAETGVLAHRPQPAAVHRGIGTARVRERPRRALVARGVARPVVGSIHGLARAHFAATASADRIRAANATSSLLPITSGVFWCRFSGLMSRMERQPSVRSEERRVGKEC